MKSIALAYCLDNIKTAEEIERQLSRASYAFDHLYCKRTTNEESLSARLRARRGPILLVISDNFLKSAQCMSGGLKLLQDRGNDILTVIVDGQSKDDQTGAIKTTPTQFDRVSDIIKYINYWQDQYLDLRKQKRQMQDESDEEKFNQHLRVMRDISGEIGEFLRTLRNMEFVEYPEFVANGFERFFRFAQDDSGWRNFQELPPLPPFEAPAPELVRKPETIVVPAPEPETVLETSANSQPTVEEKETKLVPEPVIGGIEFEPTEIPQEPEPELEPEPEIQEADETQIQGWIEAANDAAAAGAPGQALEAMANYLSLAPGNFHLHYAYAALLAQYTDNIDESINQLDTALEINPESEEALLLMGQLAELKGDFLLAKNSYEKLIDINDEHAEALYRLGMVVSAQFPDQIEQAARYFKKAAKYDEQNLDALYRYAGLLAEPLGKPRKAIKYFTRLLQADPGHLFANYDLATLHHRMGDREMAREYYLRAVKINPELKTPENDQAFAYKVTATPPVSTEMSVAHDTIEALKQSIRQLEEMLQTQEAEAARQAALPVSEPALLPGAGKTVLITGATSGIGRATAMLLAEHGFRLILTGRRKDRLEALEAALAEQHAATVKTIELDVRNVKAVEKAIERLDENWQEIDVLINNAGKAKGLHLIHEGHLEHWEEMIDTNLKGLLYMTRMVAPLMVKRGSGHILNISSTAGKEVYPKGNVYCATKFAVEALTKAMRLDLHPYHIRVSQVAPGHVEETEFALVRFDGDAEKAKIYEDFKPINAQDVAEAILWAITRPPHVNVQDILLMGTQQAGATTIHRSGRHVFEEEE